MHFLFQSGRFPDRHWRFFKWKISTLMASLLPKQFTHTRCGEDLTVISPSDIVIYVLSRRSALFLDIIYPLLENSWYHSRGSRSSCSPFNTLCQDLVRSPFQRYPYVRGRSLYPKMKSARNSWGCYQCVPEVELVSSLSILVGLISIIVAGIRHRDLRSHWDYRVLSQKKHVCGDPGNWSS